MFNPRTKFELSTITCNKEMKGNAKCKFFFVLSHPVGLRANAQGSWLNGKRVVDFLSAIIELFSLSLMAAALLSDICRNLRFLKGESL